MLTLELTQIGDSLGVVLPDELLARMRVAKGDALYVKEIDDGVVLTPRDPAIASQLDAGRQFMREYDEAFRELAK